MSIQITFDCTDPHAQARFWAAATDGVVEDHDEVVSQAIGGGFVDPDSEEVLVRDGRRAWRDFAAVVSPDDGPRLLFQRVPRAKSGKNRVHLDLHLGPGVREGKVAQLLGLGAEKLWDGQLGPQTWVTLADPEGNELCVG